MDAAGRWMGRVVFLIPTIFLLLGLALQRDWPYFPYFVTEWMVNYSAGFIRRGLIGELIWLVGTTAHVPPMNLIEVGRFAVATSFAASLGWTVFKRQRNLGWMGAAILLLAPGTSFYLWCQTGSLDLIFVLATMAHLELLRREGPRPSPRLVVFVALTGVVLALTHEALFLCLFLPLNFWIFRCRFRHVTVAEMCGAFLLPVLACCAALVYHGTEGQAHALHAHWTAMRVEQPFAIGFEQLGLSLPRELHLIWPQFSWARFLLWLINAFLCVIPAAWLFAQSRTSGILGHRLGMRELGVLFACSVPLYVVGSDWDRWISLSALLVLVTVLQTAELAITAAQRRMALGMVCWSVVVGLSVRPYAPFLPAHRFVAGPLVRAAEFFRGQMPT